MKIIEPNAKLLIQNNPYTHVAKCASICYNSEPKKGDEAVKFYNALISSGHLSMLRHESCYYMVPYLECDKDLFYMLKSFKIGENPYIQISDKKSNNFIYVATNGQFIYEHTEFKELIDQYKITPFEFKDRCPELMRYTILLVTQLSTARELNRVSPNNIAERSTRYILEGKKDDFTIVKPYWVKYNSFQESDINSKESKYYSACELAFIYYKNLIDNGVKPEDARGVLPLDTMTKVIYTYSIKEWQHILDLRLYDKTGKAHPNCHIICEQIQNILNLQ